VIGWLTRPSIIWLITASYAVGTLLAWLLVPLPRHRELSGEQRPAQKSLWRLPAFALVLLACALVQSSHAVYYGFSTLDWTKKGLSDTTIGMLWAIGVIAEVGLFAASAFINRLISPIGLILVGAFGGIVRWTLMAFDPPFYLLPPLQCLHALTFCATHIGAMQFVTHVVPPGRAASAQGDLSASQSVVFAGAMGMSGVLVNAYGDLAYGAMGLLAAAGAIVAFAAYSMWRDPHRDRTLTP
jgi:PPP family 3-phenylpropionic acid transporter